MTNTYVEFLKQINSEEIHSINYTQEDKEHFDKFIKELDENYPSTQKRNDLEITGHHIAAKKNFLAMSGFALCTTLLTTGIVIANVTDLPIDSHWSWYVTDIASALMTTYFYRGTQRQLEARDEKVENSLERSIDAYIKEHY